MCLVWRSKKTKNLCPVNMPDFFGALPVVLETSNLNHRYLIMASCEV